MENPENITAPADLYELTSGAYEDERNPKARKEQLKRVRYKFFKI
jgi:hypothetical protein